MYDMNDYYVRHQTPKPVLGFILSKADHIKDLLATPHADESISTLYIILDAYFVDAYYRYSIHVDRELARRDELHQKALAELPEDAIIPEPGPSRTYQSILIDLSEQRLYALEAGTLVLSTPVTTGRRGVIHSFLDDALCECVAIMVRRVEGQAECGWITILRHCHSNRIDFSNGRWVSSRADIDIECNSWRWIVTTIGSAAVILRVGGSNGCTLQVARGCEAEVDSNSDIRTCSEETAGRE